MKQLPTDTMGQRIRAARKHAKLTQRQLAQELDKREDYVSKLERDEFFPSVTVLIRIAEATNMSLDYIVLGKNTLAHERLNSLLSCLSPETQVEALDTFGKIIELLCKEREREHQNE